MKAHGQQAKAGIAIAAFAVSAIAYQAIAAERQAEHEPGIVSIAKVISGQWEPVRDLPFMKVVGDNKPRTAGDTLFRSKDRKFDVSISAYDKMTLEISEWPYDEYMHILEGKLQITEKSTGIAHTYGPGDGFVMRKGFSGTWRQLTPIKKIAVTYDEKS